MTTIFNALRMHARAGDKILNRLKHLTKVIIAF